MDEAFKNLEKEGKNDVENLVKWMKDSKVIDATKEQEEKARNLLKDVPDQKHVALEKFKEVVQKLAVEFKKNFDSLAKQLADGGGNKLLEAAMGASNKLNLGK